MQPSKFRWIEFEWDEHNLAEIDAHGLQFFEAEECFYRSHRVYRNKKKSGRTYETFKLEGKSEAGRPILLIFLVKGKRSVGLKPGSNSTTTALIRVITGWER